MKVHLSELGTTGSVTQLSMLTVQGIRRCLAAVRTEQEGDITLRRENRFIAKPVSLVFYFLRNSPQSLNEGVLHPWANP